MKNIHVLPTDKPSRLIIYSTLLNEFRLLDEPIEDWKHKRHIYITSNEEIKEGDYVVQINFEKTNTQVIKCETEFQTKIANSKDGSFSKNKIILTTDQDLIKDGVQAIDDEFLEWFIKNPSCDFAHLGFKSIIGDSETKTTYKIIIPKEEPKQETLEEAVYKFYPEDEQWTDRYVFKLGAKWQAERMYSEEEVRHLMTLAFEQGFKKADIVEAGLEAKETDTEVNWIFLKHKK